MQPLSRKKNHATSWHKKKFPTTWHKKISWNLLAQKNMQPLGTKKEMQISWHKKLCNLSAQKNHANSQNTQKNEAFSGTKKKITQPLVLNFFFCNLWAQKSQNLMAQNKSCNLLRIKKRNTQPLITKKKHATYRQKTITQPPSTKNQATSWNIKKHATLGTKKSCNLFAKKIREIRAIGGNQSNKGDQGN